MLRLLRPAVVSFLILSSCTFLAAAEWQAGLSKAAITPRKPVWLSGYGGRDRPAEGKVHDLFAKAVAFQSPSGTRLVLVTTDLGSMSPEIYNHVLRQAESQWKLGREALVINASHTHCAPEICAERRVFHKLTDQAEADLVDYIDNQLKPTLVKLVGDALADLKPAQLSVSQSAAYFGKSRRFPTTEGEFINQRNDAGITDNTVPVLKITGPKGKLRGVLFGYACHNTTLAFYQFCGDYAGFAQYDIEEQHPGAVAMFVMGCGGDQNPYPRHGPNGLNYCKQHGRELADAVLTSLKGPQLAIKGELQVASTDVTLDLEPLPPLETIRTQAEGGQETPTSRKANYLLKQIETNGQVDLTQNCPLNVARFGDDLLFVFVSGETVLDYARLCQFAFGGQMVWVAGYNNDVFAYLPSQRILLEGGYEGRTGIIHQLTPTPFLPTVEDRVMGGIRQLVEKVSQPVPVTK
ncbi:Neutral/alkaline non-lysosomal ceramidase [Polystyrenella longa]|uniref:Neutral/alkaline non-lysosomal ceramidase n=1 Tax=Polystyrenella longa TaxID=2528007 RepID=A0A518CPH0_9PLAN|nr:neutral/alkaline non-lysosomal ceramidase N-terminal domain-containing protein [Polystyrenella longa]QDU81121.1 Neutral/alkaline non-lysosomal ceramidase [Polystyrenella longa]